jgi:Cu+-exporting ATPase
LSITRVSIVSKRSSASAFLQTAKGFDENELLRLAASLERGSEHPLAAAILRAAADRGLSLSEARSFASPVGKGVTGTVDGKRLVLGGARMMSDEGADVRPLLAGAETMRRGGATTIFATVDGKLAGVLGLADPIKASTPEAVRALKAQGVGIVMMTGDNRATAMAVAGSLGSSTSKPRFCPRTRPMWCGSCAPRAATSPWPATASTTPRPWQRPRWGWPWAPARTWRSRARA